MVRTQIHSCFLWTVHLLLEILHSSRCSRSRPRLIKEEWPADGYGSKDMAKVENAFIEKTSETNRTYASIRLSPFLRFFGANNIVSNLLIITSYNTNLFIGGVHSTQQEILQGKKH